MVQGDSWDANNWGAVHNTNIATNENPFFDSTQQNYTLAKNSPAINAGNNDHYTHGDRGNRNINIDLDLGRNKRLIKPTIDMGAYEYPGAIQPSTNNIIYVNKNVDQTKHNYTGSGNSWANAAKELRYALDWAKDNPAQFTESNPLQIWVAQGEYQPDDNQSFKMFNHVEIYGGFNATETTLEERNWETNETILKGNGKSVFRNGYSTSNPLTNSAILDGFTITNGNANLGGGMFNVYASPTLNHLIIHNNIATADGGGIYNTFSSSPILNHVLIYHNSAVGIGGGIMCSNNSSLVLNHVIIHDNTAKRGGGMYNVNSSPILTNVLIHHNKANERGGGIFINGDSPILTNVTISNNKSEEGGGIYMTIPSAHSVKIYNSIIQGNTKLDGTSINNIITVSTTKPSIHNSLIGGTSWDATHWGVNDDSNIVNNTTPFVNPANGNYTLSDGSPAINTGKNSYYTDPDKGNGDLINDLDLEGNPRLVGINIEMGAFEYLGIEPSTNNILYVNKHVIGGLGTGDSWENAIPELRSALNWVNSRQMQWNPNNTLQIWVAKGEYGQFFKMYNFVEIYGGFDATESELEERDWKTNETILKGYGDSVIRNAYSPSNPLTNSAILDGFTITNGKSREGGGVYNRYASPTLKNLNISNNHAHLLGGGVFNNNSSPIITHSIFTENTADHGGAIYNINNSSPILTNILIHNNTTSGNGGGICNHDSNLILTNVTITNNRAPAAGSGIHIHSGRDFKMYNSIVYGNLKPNGQPSVDIVTSAKRPSIYNSLLQGSTWDFFHWGDDDGSNLVTQTDPFSNAANADYTLAQNSPAINTGKNTYYTDADKGNGNLENDLDLAGYLRLSDTTIDMGPYEFQTCEEISFENDSISFCDEPYRLLTPSSTDNSYEYTWSPFQGLYLDEDLLVAYEGQVAQQVYASPDNTTTYTTHAYSSLRGCTIEKSIVVNKLDNRWNSTNGFNWHQAENWSLNQVPTIDHCVKIDHTKPVIIEPEIHAQAKSLWIGENGGLDIRNRGSLTVQNFIHTYADVDSNQRLIVRQGGNLIQKSTTAQNIGEIAVEKVVILSDERKQYNFISSPVIYPGSIKDFLYSSADPNAVLIEYNEATNFFDYSNGKYTAAKGYAFQEKSGGPQFDQPLFKGEIPNGTITIPLSKNTDGYNLIGNPYPSNIDLQSIYTRNINNISSDFYFWDNRSNTLFEQQGPEYDGRHYAVYNAYNNSGTAAPFKSTAPKIPDRYASVGSAFLVKANRLTQFEFINSDRVTNRGIEFLGKGNFTEEMDRYWLTMTTPSELSVMNAVVYFEEGSHAFGEDDSEAMSASDELYTLINEHQVIIEGKPPFQISDKVPLGYRAFEEGEHQITIFKQEGVFDNGQTKIYLIDEYLNLTHNLSESAYHFKTEAGEFNDRFIIVYEEDEVLTNLDFEKDDIQVYRQDKNTVIRSLHQDLNELKIFNLNGQLLLYEDQLSGKYYSLPEGRLGKQTLLLNVTTADGKVHSFKILTH